VPCTADASAITTCYGVQVTAVNEFPFTATEIRKFANGVVTSASITGLYTLDTAISMGTAN